MSTTSHRQITAAPAGRDRDGAALAPRVYLIDRDPEDWGNGRSRIFAENRSAKHPGGSFIFTPVVVLTDSIMAAPAATTENLPDIICRVMAWWITSSLDDGSSLSGATMAIPSTGYRRERLTTWIREMGRLAAIDALRAYAKSPAELRAIAATS